jgi:hypothetical protein
MRIAFGSIIAALVLISCATAQVDQALPQGALSLWQPPLLEAAFQAFLDGQQRWSYVETGGNVKADGSISAKSVIRNDPSMPYARQSVPLLINGQEPTEKQLRDWAANCEKQAQRRLKAVEALTAAARDQGFRLRLLNREVRSLLEEATAIAEDETSITYEIPMQELGGPEAPRVADHRLTARVGRATRQFEHVTIHQTKMVRIAAGKYYDGLTEVDFARPDPNYASVPIRITFTVTNKPLVGAGHTSMRLVERKDFRRVTPYDERFNVKLGPLNLLEF